MVVTKVVTAVDPMAGMKALRMEAREVVARVAVRAYSKVEKTAALMAALMVALMAAR